jgi:GNAT superfamily N-acetyltransferase
MRNARIYIYRNGANIIATLRMATKRPWAIDPAPFTPVCRPLYLTDMAVHPDFQRLGVGRMLMSNAEKEALRVAGDAIRLDAYDAEAGAGEFYSKCGYAEVGRVTYRGTPLVYFERLLPRPTSPSPPTPPPSAHPEKRF